MAYMNIYPILKNTVYPNNIANEIKKVERNNQGFYQFFNVRVGINRYLDICALITQPIPETVAGNVASAWSKKYASVEESG
jgi:hypothetical protein